MLTALWVVFWIIVILVGAVALLVLTPTLFLIDARFGANARMRLRVGPLGGLLPTIPVFDSGRPRDRTPKSETAQKAGGASSRPERRRGSRRASGRRMIAAVPDLLGGLSRAVHIEDIAVSVDVGTGDPADTGTLYGGLSPFLYGVWPGASASVEIRPDFTRARLDGSASVRVRVTPAALAPPAIRFGWAAFGPAR